MPFYPAPVSLAATTEARHSMREDPKNRIHVLTAEYQTPGLYGGLSHAKVHFMKILSELLAAGFDPKQ